jgi:hypothetical protein
MPTRRIFAGRRRRGIVAALLLGLVASGLGACRAGSPRDVPPDGDDGNATRVTASAPSVAATTSARAEADARAKASLDAALRRVSDARGLAARRPVELKTMDRDQLLTHLMKKVEKELPPGVLTLQGEALRALGVFPPGYEFEKGILALLQGQIAGFYDPDERAMFLLEDLSDASRDETLNHELVHALQDQAARSSLRSRGAPRLPSRSGRRLVGDAGAGRR